MFEKSWLNTDRRADDPGVNAAFLWQLAVILDKHNLVPLFASLEAQPQMTLTGKRCGTISVQVANPANPNVRDQWVECRMAPNGRTEGRLLSGYDDSGLRFNFSAADAAMPGPIARREAIRAAGAVALQDAA